MKNANNCIQSLKHITGSAAAHHRRPGIKDLTWDRRWWGETERMVANAHDQFFGKRTKLAVMGGGM